MRAIRFVLTLSILLISATHARAALELSQPARWTVQLPAGLDDLEEPLRKAHFARVDIDGHSVVLRKPRVTPEGLAYESIEGFPTPRPAIVVGADWDSIPARPNPIPWDDIDRIEAGTQDRPFAIVGGLVGLLAGLWVGMQGVEEPADGVLLLATTTAAGAGLGALLPITHWKQIYPEPEESAQR